MSAASTASVCAPLAPAFLPTHTSANELVLLSSPCESSSPQLWWCLPKNCVSAVTLTVIVLPSRSTIVNDPSAPWVPQVPSSLTPFTDVTSPNTAWWSPLSSPGSSVFGGTMNTAAAVTVESVTSPLANASSPTHTLANV